MRKFLLAVILSVVASAAQAACPRAPQGDYDIYFGNDIVGLACQATVIKVNKRKSEIDSGVCQMYRYGAMRADGIGITGSISRDGGRCSYSGHLAFLNRHAALVLTPITDRHLTGIISIDQYQSSGTINLVKSR